MTARNVLGRRIQRSLDEGVRAFRLRCEELTGQTRSPAERLRRFRGIFVDEAGNYDVELDRKAKEIDMLSVTTTMEVGIDIGSLAEFRTVENTPDVHNVVVCTLCSCYPKLLLGIPPAWYKSMAYRSRVVVDPRGVLAEYGLKQPENVEVRVHDSTADLRYLVLPLRPTGTDGWSEEQLAALVTRDCMIGTAVPEAAKPQMAAE